MSDNGVQLHMSDRQILEAEEVSRAELEGTIGLERIATHKLEAERSHWFTEASRNALNVVSLKAELTALREENAELHGFDNYAQMKAALLNGNNPTTKEK